MNNATPEDVLRFTQALRQLEDQTGEHLRRFGTEPASQSIAANELESHHDQSPLKTAYGQGDLLITAAADHLDAVLRALSEPILTIAAWASARGLMEAAALSAWLLDPRINPTNRMKRSFAFRYSGLVQQHKFLAVSQGLDSDWANRRIEEVERDASHLGFEPLRSSKGRRTGIGQIMPPMTSLVHEVLEDEASYRLLSAMTHAHPWVVQQVSFHAPTPATDPKCSPPTEKPEEYSLRKAAKPSVILFLCIKVGEFFLQPIRFKCSLFGWDLPGLTVVIQEIVEAYAWLHDRNGDRYELGTWK